MGIFDIFKKKKKAEKKPLIKKEAPKITTKKVVHKKKKGEIYKFLKEPHISEKATYLSDQGKYVFKIFSWANKIQVKEAITNLYGVRIKDIKIINIKPKKRTLRGSEGTKSGYKKAIVTLEKGEKIEILPH